jgi:hypothetical protein
MGVLVIYIHWKIDAESFHQFFYIEITETGIESYRSLLGDDALHMMEIEQTMLGGLGSVKVDISEREAVLLIQEYAALNRKYGEELPGGLDEYAFILNRKMDVSENEVHALFAKTCIRLENENQLINYFLMRYFSGDGAAVEYLSDGRIDREISVSKYQDTLCLNTIEVRKNLYDEVTYLCESLVESDTEHRLIISELALGGGFVTAFDIISSFSISPAETAMKLERPEFITVYDILADTDRVLDFLDDKYQNALKRDTDEGRLYLRFNENNDHLKQLVYRLNDDIKGMLYVTDEGQLILAAYSLTQIQRLERSAQTWPFAREIMIIAKYEFKEDVFYDFIKSDGGDFVRYVEEICEFGPEDED